jgi:hypothetical protein
LSLKQKKQLTIFGMVSNCQITSDEGHVAELALASVVIEAIQTPAIFITELGAALAAENQDNWMSCQYTYAALASAA